MNVNDIGLPLPTVLERATIDKHAGAHDSPFYLSVFGTDRPQNDGLTRRSDPITELRNRQGSEVADFQAHYLTVFKSSHGKVIDQIKVKLDFFGTDPDLTHIMFFPMESLRHTFEAHCEIFHQNGETIWDAKHPISPEDSGFRCPVCSRAAENQNSGGLAFE
jgi:hypothetical protein